MFGRHPRFQLVGSLFALIIALAIGFLPAAAQQPAPAQVLQTTFPFYQDAAIAKAVSYLRTQQLPSGAIDSFTFGADPGGTSRLLLALNAVGYPSATFVKEGKSLLDYLESELVNYIYANDTPGAQNLFPGRTGLVLAAVAASGADPRSFGGRDLVAELSGTYNPSDGTYSTSATEQFASGAASPINQTLAIIGLVAAGQPIPEPATQWLIANQGADGSWSNSIDVTGYGVVALIGSGNVPPTDPAIQKALAFYRASQTLTTALWGDAGSGEPANSTGWTMTALSTYGYAPMADSWATGGTNPRQALIGLQTDEGVIAKRFFNAYATLEALYGLSDQPLFMTTPLRAERALAYITSRQNADGGWPGFGSSSSPGETLDNLFAFVAAGYNPTAVESGAGNSPLDYLAGATATYTRNSTGILPAQTGKLIVGVVAAGSDPRSFGTPTAFDLVADMENTLQATGAYSSTASAASVTNQSFAILGLRAAGRTVPQNAIAYLASLQGPNGSWGSIFNSGLALQALIAAGVPPTNPDVVEGVNYLRTSQAAIGGWEDFGSFSPTSTAYAIQGLLAAGVDLNTSDWLKNGRSPLGVLASYQKPDGPFVFGWTPGSGFNPADDSLFTTQQAVPALLGATYPYTATAPADLSGSYTPLKRGPDPDRLVVAPPFITFNANRTQATLTAPFGSDLNGDATATLEWNIESGRSRPAAFQSIPATRGPGYFRATLNLSATPLGPTDVLVVRATFTDPDGVQSGGTISTQPVAVIGRAEPNRYYLPLIAR
ncbi:MAG: hypothetical protein HXY37_02060 [Chloroflexi bacterium]|nr:hypothetical protein [Chloroflexota bacterium]